jgi:hypothetical protein
MTGDRDTAGHDAAADQEAGVARDNPAAVDDGAVNGAAAADGDAGRRAGNEVAVEEAAGQERAADDGDAACPDRAGIGDAATEGGGADYHGGGMAAELGRVWPGECHEAPQRPVRPKMGSTESASSDLRLRLQLGRFRRPSCRFGGSTCAFCSHPPPPVLLAYYPVSSCRVDLNCNSVVIKRSPDERGEIRERLRA